MNYYELHIGDYEKGTAHLTACEDGIYGRLLRRYYDTEAPLPADLKAVQRLVRARAKDEREAVETVLGEFFALTADGWRHGRCDAEIGRYNEKRAKAKRSAEARWNGCERNANASETHCVGNAHQTPDTSHQSPVTSSSSGRETTVPPAADGGGWGSFEGHADPKPSTPHPAAAHAIALRAEGFACTPYSPPLVAYVQAGGTVEHLQAVMALPDCAGKKAGYVLSIARRELAERAAPVVAQARAGPSAAPTSKTAQAVQTLLGMRRDEHLAPQRDSGRLEQAALLESGTHPRR